MPAVIEVDAGPEPKVWTVPEFHRMIDLGVFRKGIGKQSVMLLEGVIWEQHHNDPVDPSPRPLRFTRDQFEMLTAHQFLSGQRAQLLGGKVYVMPAMKEPHACGIVMAMDALRPAFVPGHYFRPQMPLDLGTTTDPEPDVAVVAGRMQRGAPTPTTAALVVEVADTSLTHDLTVKAEWYAAGGIADYWVVDVVGQRLHVLRDPAPVTAGGHAYRTQLTFGPADSVSPLAAPTAVIAVADLLP